MEVKSYYFDKKINKYFDNYLFLFRDIHPNTITITGIFINGIAYYTYFYMKNKHLTAILLIFRVICDNLDGSVARKFNKVSHIGGLLDGIADSLLVSTIWYSVFDYFNINYKLCLSINAGCIMFLYLIYYDAVFIHNNLTNSKNGNFLNKISYFIYENTYLSILLVIFIMYLS